MTSSRSSRVACWAVRVAAALAALATVLLPACTSSPRAPALWRAEVPDTAFGELGVWQVVCEDTWGSALALGDGRFLTCRHVLPATGGTVQVKAPGENLGVLRQEADGRNVLRLEDAPEREVTIVASGGADYDPDDPSTVSADWAIFEVSPSHHWAQHCDPPAVDFERELAPGEDIFLVGYHWSRSRPLPPGPLVVPAGILSGRVRSVPPLCNFAPGPDVICVDILGETRDRTGMSGGPALVWDAEANRLVVVGLCEGVYPCTFIGLPAATIPTVIRPPAQALGRTL
jgi:hypothetical protein